MNRLIGIRVSKFIAVLLSGGGPRGAGGSGRSRQGIRPAAGRLQAACAGNPLQPWPPPAYRSEEHTSELQSLMRISYAVFCLKQKRQNTYQYARHIIKMN